MTRVLICLLLAANAAAETKVALPEISIIGSREKERELPGSGSYLDTEDIRFHSYDDIHRILRKVPGVYVREEDGHGLFPNISLRGVSVGRSQKVTLMEDGIPMSPAPYSAPAAYFSPSAGRMRAIEVLKGSSQIKYGPHTTGGAINYLSTAIPEKRRSFMKTMFGSHNEAQAHVYHGETVGTGWGRFGYLAEFYGRRSDGFKTIQGTLGSNPSQRTGFQRAEPMLKLAWEPETERYQRLEAMIGYSDITADETYMGLSEEDFRADPYQRYAATRFDQLRSWQSRSYLRHSWQPADNVQLVNTAYYTNFHRNWYKLDSIAGFQLSRALSTPSTLEVLKGRAAGTLNVRANNRDYYVGGLDSAAKIGFDWGPSVHELELGARAHYDKVRRFQWQDSYTQAANGAITDIVRGPFGGAGNQLEESRALALYGQDSVKIDRLTLTPGVRYEHVRYDFHNYANGMTRRGHLNIWAPGVGFNFRASDEVAVFGGVHRGFSVPGPQDNAVNQVKEETSNSYELGARYAPRKGVVAEATFFHTSFRNLIVVGNVGAGGSSGGVTENVGNIRSLGTELKAEVDPGVIAGWSVRNPNWITATFTRATLRGDSRSNNAESLFSGGRDGNLVPYVPKAALAFGTGVETDGWAAKFAASYTGETFTTANNSGEQINPVTNLPDARFGKTDPYFLVDLSGHLRLSERVKLIGSVRNLFDKAYLVSRHPHGPRPGLPRTFLAGLQAEF